MNWFEGGRRIVSLLALLIVAGGGAYVLFTGGDNRVVLQTSSPKDRPTWGLSECNYPDYDESYRNKSQFGPNAEPRTLTMCFRANEDGKIVITYPERLSENYGLEPPSTEHRREITANPYSDDAKTYMSSRMNEFEFTQAEANEIVDGQWMIGWARFSDRVAEAAPWTAGLLFGLLAITGGIGWIIRGFAGVPVRSDFRADSDHAKKLVPQRVSNEWISVAIAICLVAWGIASGIASTFGPSEISTEPTIWSKAGNFLGIIILAGIGITIAGIGGYGFGKLIQRFRPKFEFGGEKGDVLGISFLNLMLVIVVSIPIGLYTVVGSWIDQIDHFSRSHDLDDGATVAVLVISLLWPWIPLWAIEQFDLLKSTKHKDEPTRES